MSKFLLEDGDRIQSPKGCMFQMKTGQRIITSLYHGHALLDLKNHTSYPGFRMPFVCGTDNKIEDDEIVVREV
jgi:hypothetical protein